MAGLLIQFRRVILVLIDIILGYFALSATLLIKYGLIDFYPQFHSHLLPFSVIILLFLFSFYIFNLYSFRFNRNITELIDSFTKSIILSFTASISIFYIFGNFFKVAPKTNLVIFTIIFGVLDFYVRLLLKRYYSHKKINRKIFIINNTHNHLVDELKKNQNIGYEIIKETNTFNYQEVLEMHPDIVIIDSIQNEAFEKLYPLLQNKIAIYTINMFYEETFQKIPTETVDKDKVVEYVNKDQTLFTFIKRLLDVVMSFIFLILVSPFWIIISLIIKLTSKGPILYKQTRVKINDTLFTIYKFRSMKIDAEKEGAVWTTNDQTDTRITMFGKFLRKTHLDEIPQLINILRGDISFVGPRPERPEFTKMLNEKVQYYDLRHAVKPGLTGWAQINYQYGSSIEDSKEKLKYDFYYIKNRNIFLDFLIILKTIAMLLQKR
jgi:exopolysaccharide biosynthesis polyprenyl glycosylphosphotransferase